MKVLKIKVRWSFGDAQGREYLVYLESGGSVSVKVQPADPAGYVVKWINARET
jgi:hypothetical protein